MFQDRANPKATQSSYAVAAMEDEFLQKLLDLITDKHPQARSMTLMFDGAVVCIAAEHRAGLRSSLERSSTRITASSCG